MREYLIVDENLRAAMRFFGTATGSGEICTLPGGIAIWSGLDYGVSISPCSMALRRPAGD
jgi:hypothetical protein